MADFSEIIGQKALITHLQASIAHGKVSHAYLLEGPKHSGKMLLASAFAKTLQCEEKGTCACGVCKSCKQVEGHNHPDVIFVDHEKPNTLSVEDIRRQVNGDVAIKPYAGTYKIYIIDDAEKMNPQAQNALLKTIEEPPAYVIIILLATNRDALLPTILSRCICLSMATVSDKVIQDHLMKQLSLPDYQAETCSAIARGNVGRAICLASDEEFFRLKDFTLELVRGIREKDRYRLPALVTELEEYRLQMDDFFDFLRIWYRDVLYWKATNETQGLILKNESYHIRNAAKSSSYEGMEHILQEIERARTRLASNVNFTLTMELLLLAMKEN